MPSRTSILETVNKVTASPPKLKPKLTIGFFAKIAFDVKTTFKEHPYLSAGCVLGVAFGCLSLLRGRMRRTRGGHFKLDDHSGGGKEYKSPLLGLGGVSANGSKTD